MRRRRQPRWRVRAKEGGARPAIARRAPSTSPYWLCEPLQPVDRLGIRGGDHGGQRRELVGPALALLLLGEGKRDELLEQGDVGVVWPDDDVGERRHRVRRRLLLLEA